MAPSEQHPDIDLSAEKLELLEYLLAEEGIGVPQLAAILRRSDAGPAPLSFAQIRLWFLDRWQPGAPVYHVVSTLRLEGELDAGALERSLGEIVRRHEILRTTFRELGNEPVQEVAPEAPARLPVVDLAGLTAAARSSEAERVAGREARRPFDLVRGPLWRPLLLRLAPGEHTLFFALHHILADGWSMGVMV
ncbi:MAG TPA: condensation domain-containing protein, partial [Thermoanaerobaculia bacterium]|nr:condensation domain-containing protein [Thermoanaerobaculia bacterium]